MRRQVMRLQLRLTAAALGLAGPRLTRGAVAPGARCSWLRSQTSPWLTLRFPGRCCSRCPWRVGRAQSPPGAQTWGRHTSHVQQPAYSHDISTGCRRQAAEGFSSLCKDSRKSSCDYRSCCLQRSSHTISYHSISHLGGVAEQAVQLGAQRRAGEQLVQCPTRWQAPLWADDTEGRVRRLGDQHLVCARPAQPWLKSSV
jgi:hypothetical protein